MPHQNPEVIALAKEFESCQKLFVALGDANRQHLLLEMMQMGECTGVRVGDIAAKTNLSRPAVSHHIQILKDAGIIKMRREGTKHYYYFDESTAALDELLQVLAHARAVMKQLPDRSGLRMGDDSI